MMNPTDLRLTLDEAEIEHVASDDVVTTLPENSTVTQPPTREAEAIVGAMLERVLLAEGAQVRAVEDRELAEADMAAGFEVLPPA
jgi:hypothetical protein